MQALERDPGSAEAQRAPGRSQDVDMTMETFRHAITSTFVPLTVSSDESATFRGQLRSVELGAVQLAEVAADNPSMVYRSQKEVHQSAPDYLKVSLLVRGRCVVIQDGREAELTRGDYAIYDTTRPYRLVLDGPYRFVVLMFPRDRLRLAPAQLSHVTVSRVRGQEGLAGSVSPFLRGLVTESDAAGFTRNNLLADAILDMLAASLVERLPEEARGPRSGRKALLLRVRMFIEQRLGDPSLDGATIAAAHHISVRFLQSLFEDDGETVTGWIRARRIERCRRDLADPRLAQIPVGTVAARWGLIDAAHFSRLFKAAYGVPPTRYRAGELT